MKGMKQWLRVGFLAAIAVGGWCVLILITPPQNAAAPETPSADATAAPRTFEKSECTLLFTGDVMLSRAVGLHMAAQKDWSLPFHLIEDTLRSADLRYCNLECPVSDRGHNLHHLYSFRADPRVIEGLKATGFNVASQANNHTYDWGPEALLDSLERLRAAGIQPVGAGQNILAAHYPLLVHVGGLRVAFLAYVDIDPKEATAGVDRPGVAWLDPGQALADIRFSRPLADLVIVCPHWGVEYASQPTRDQVELAHQMIDAGADMIVGSHPHVVQPLEKYHDHWIAYSLGNFIFDQQDYATHHGLMLQVKVREKQITEVLPIPIKINSSFQAALAPVADPLPKLLLAERKPPVLPAP
ncbi:MAG: CapA family protein [Terriglobia bacterium]|jgi:poly-gamma-glutamate synthesis protein (capsule biosynthesis protein)